MSTATQSYVFAIFFLLAVTVAVSLHLVTEREALVLAYGVVTALMPTMYATISNTIKLIRS